MNNELDLEAIRQSPRQFVDLETVIALSDRCMCLALQADEVNAARIYLREKGRLLTELAEKNAEIERLQFKLQRAEMESVCAKREAAASQTREQQLREALQVAAEVHVLAYRVRNTAINALALPQDTSAMEALIARAGEVMRERCAEKIESQHAWITSVGASALIRALPGVTLEDLQK